MMHNSFSLLTFVFLFTGIVNSAKILAVFPIPSISHQLVFQPIWKELSLRGHHVTVLTPNPLNDPNLINLTEIDLSFQYRVLEEYKHSLSKGRSHWALMGHMEPLIEAFLPKILESKEMQGVINDNTEKYDVVLAETMDLSTYAFSAKYECPLIGIASLTAFTQTHEAVGNPTHPILHPSFYIPYYGAELDFFQKIDSLLFSIYEKFVFQWRLMPLINRIVRKYFGETLPDLQDIERNMSLLLLNTNPIIHGSRPYGPNVIEFGGGGIHLKPKKSLPLELKTFLDNATEGVVYFSLGSNVKSKSLPEKTKDILLNTFAKLPYKILWKFEDDHLENKPENVKIVRWLPQQDLLGHPNIKLFITQGGLQSLEEALFNSVPMLVIPFMADQYVNSRRVEKLGVGLRMDFITLSENMLLSSILEIIDNPRYKLKTLDISRALKDQPMQGLEKVVWWTEFVIRNKGAPYLKNPRGSTTWSEFLILDVIGFLLFCLIIFTFVSYKILNFLVKLVLKPNKTKME